MVNASVRLSPRCECRERGRLDLRQDGVELEFRLPRILWCRTHRGHDGLAAAVIAQDIGGADDPGRLDHGGDRHAALTARRLDHGGAHGRLDEHRNGAPARQADFPRGLVGNAVGDEAGGAPVRGLGDLTGHGTLDTAARHRTQDGTRGRRQHDGARLARRAAPYLRDHRATDRLVPGDQALVIRQGLEGHVVDSGEGA